MHLKNQPRTTLGWVIAASSLGFLFAAGVHLLALVSPVAGDPSPSWRHALFVAINITAVSGVVLRWRGFLPLFSLLLVQQVYTHGWLRWQSGEMNGQDVGVVLGMPLLFVLLLLDWPKVQTADKEVTPAEP